MNPYDIYCMHKMIDSKQCTIFWQVEDTKASHEDPWVLAR